MHPFGSEFLLGSTDINGSPQFLLAVVLEVHEFGVSKDKPAHLPVPAGQGGHSSPFLVEPAWLERLLLGPKPHKRLVLQNTPASAPWNHQPTLKMKNKLWLQYIRLLCLIWSILFGYIGRVQKKLSKIITRCQIQIKMCLWLPISW